MMIYGISFMHPHKHILPSTGLLIWTLERIPYNSMYESSRGWTLGCLKHVEDAVIKLQHWCKKCAFSWFLLHRWP